MQIFTTDQIIQVYILSRQIAQSLFESLLAAAWHNIFDFVPSMLSAFATHDWNKAAIYVVILVGSVAFLYRLVRRNLAMSVHAIFDH